MPFETTAFQGLTFVFAPQGTSTSSSAPNVGDVPAFGRRMTSCVVSGTIIEQYARLPNFSSSFKLQAWWFSKLAPVSMHAMPESLRSKSVRHSLCEGANRGAPSQHSSVNTHSVRFIAPADN
ncbi:hypothetical protein BDW22DRAFT_927666 [Trametopsis cervina]|nr:hypothetical protein BDW22DRAFT_927666 [Trametopsis cervina]